jgi:hypothetical protein
MVRFKKMLTQTTVDGTYDGRTTNRFSISCLTVRRKVEHEAGTLPLFHATGVNACSLPRSDPALGTLIVATSLVDA